MAPSATADHVEAPQTLKSVPSPSTITEYPAPLKPSAALEAYEYFDVTSIIGREFPKANLVEWLNAPNSDELIRDLAITISQRGVVFFRAQDDLTLDLQKKLIMKLGQLTGCPKTSGLHVHPLLNNERKFGGDDPEISTINNQQLKSYNFTTGDYSENGVLNSEGVNLKKQNNAAWHSDIVFEPVPAAYTSLRLTQLPKTGGDTLWASGYETYDRISAPYQKFLESLTATSNASNFNVAAKMIGADLFEGPRGAPENVGTTLKAVHPVVRTNPVTGWKSIYAVGQFSHINGLTTSESDHLLKWFKDLIYQNHDLQVRQKWKNKNDIALWDNRSVYHTMTLDIDGQGDRHGVRAVGIGERPYFDPNSTSRREDLKMQYILRNPDSKA